MVVSVTHEGTYLMPVYIEALLLLLPPEASGRTSPVFPRDGSYRPFVRIDGAMTRARLLEGPPHIAPGEEARVVIEIERGSGTLQRGAELPLLELEERVVGIVTVVRVCREAVPA